MTQATKDSIEKSIELTQRKLHLAIYSSDPKAKDHLMNQIFIELETLKARIRCVE